MPKESFILSGLEMNDEWNFNSVGEFFFDKFTKNGTSTALVKF